MIKTAAASMDEDFGTHSVTVKPSATREGAFNWIAARTQGGSFYANDFQRVSFYSGFYENTESCASTNSNASC